MSVIVCSLTLPRMMTCATGQRGAALTAVLTQRARTLQGIAHRAGATGGTADVHLAPPPGDRWAPGDDAAVTQPMAPMVRMVSWQDAHGKDLYTARPPCVCDRITSLLCAPTAPKRVAPHGSAAVWCILATGSCAPPGAATPGSARGGSL